MNSALSEQGHDLIFRKARSHDVWLDRAVPDELLRELYELMKWGPTSGNTNPLRIVFVRTKAAKERLRPALQGPNVDKTMSAPVTAILAYDLEFHHKMPQLFPDHPALDRLMAALGSQPDLVNEAALMNSSLQGAYFMIAARALGLDVGAMAGFDKAKVDEEFFDREGGKSPDGGGPLAGKVWKSNFLCNIGYGDSSKLVPRRPRLPFEEACVLL